MVVEIIKIQIELLRDMTKTTTSGVTIVVRKVPCWCILMTQSCMLKMVQIKVIGPLSNSIESKGAQQRLNCL